jgi:hypothetical protein
MNLDCFRAYSLPLLFYFFFSKPTNYGVLTLITNKKQSTKQIANQSQRKSKSENERRKSKVREREIELTLK